MKINKDKIGEYKIVRYNKDNGMRWKRARSKRPKRSPVCLAIKEKKWYGWTYITEYDGVFNDKVLTFCNYDDAKKEIEERINENRRNQI